MTGVRACVVLSVILGIGGGGPPGQHAWGRSSASQPVVATAEPASLAAKTHSPEDETLFNRAIEVLQEDPFPAKIDPAVEIVDVTDGHVRLTFLTGLCDDEKFVLEWLSKRSVADAEAEAAMLRCFLVFRPVTIRLDEYVEEIIHCRRLQVAVEKIPGCKGVSWVKPDEMPLMHGLALNAKSPAAHNNVGVMLWLAAERRPAAERAKATELRRQAVEEWRAAVRINPAFSDALNNLGCALRHREPEEDDAAYNKRLEEAVHCFQAAIAAMPDHVDAQSNLGLTLWQLKRPKAALKHLKKALSLRPNHIDANVTYAQFLCEMARTAEAAGKEEESTADLQEAVRCLNRAIRLDAHNARAFELLGNARQQQGEQQEAVRATSTAAWLMATDPKPLVRNGRRAVELAEKLVRDDGGREPKSLDILAAACAENGDFAKAVETEKKAVELAADSGQELLAAAMRQRLSLYDRRMPFRDTPKAEGRLGPTKK